MSTLQAIETPTALSHTPSPARLDARSWLWFHLKIGLFGFGHGAVMPMYERLLVRDTKTLSAEAFQKALTVAMILPGPSLVTLNMALGKQLYGNGVAALGVLAMCVPGAVWALLIARAVPVHHPPVAALFRGFAVGALVLLLAMVHRLANSVARERVGIRKQGARAAIAIAVALALQAGVPMAAVTFSGVALCLLAEFAL